MGSFQQIIMGCGCLIAAFWFGSHLQNQPVGQNQTVALLPDGTIDPTQTITRPTLLEQTKGFVSSLFESPTKPKPITVNDLRQRSLSAVPNPAPNPVVNADPSFRLPVGQPRTPVLPRLKTDVRKDLIAAGNGLSNGGSNSLSNGVSNGVSNGDSVQRLVGSFVTDPEMQESVQPVQSPALQRVAIVPDFSSLAEEVNRGLSFNDVQTHRPVIERPSPELIPVPKFSDVAIAKPAPQIDTDWESVRQQVATAERRLANYREQMTQPIPRIADSVTQQTNKFWDRQQAEARRQQPSLVSDEGQFERERRLKPESWTDKQNRWDVFPTDTNTRNANTQQLREVQPTPQPNQPREYQPQRQPVVDRQARVARQRFDDRRVQRNTSAEIVEVDRRFVSPDLPAAVPVKSRVRSLNDDRDELDSVPDNRWEQGSSGVAMQRRQGDYVAQRTEVRNDLRPAFDRNAGSNPEFVSPPQYRQPADQGSSPSEIVEAAKVTYGSFREYQTRAGDSLQKISQEFYGKPDYYYDLYLANRALLSNPATVPPGVTLKIPRFDGN